jgi:hypothetical protein
MNRILAEFRRRKGLEPAVADDNARPPQARSRRPKERARKAKAKRHLGNKERHAKPTPGSPSTFPPPAPFSSFGAMCLNP